MFLVNLSKNVQQIYFFGSCYFNFNFFAVSQKYASYFYKFYKKEIQILQPGESQEQYLVEVQQGTLKLRNHRNF